MKRFLEDYLLTESFKRVPPLNFFEFYWSELVQEFIDGEVAASYPDLNLALFHPNIDSLRAELVHALTLPQKHNLQLVPVRVVVYVLSQVLVDWIIFYRHIDGHSRFQINHV